MQSAVCVLSRSSVVSIFSWLLATSVCAAVSPEAPPAGCERLVKAEVVALEQAIVLNRYGAFNPSGMLFALKRDVVLNDGTALSDANIKIAPGNVKLRDDKRPRPIVLRVNEGDCLEVRFHNLLMTAVPDERTRGPEQYDGRVPGHMEDPGGVVYPTRDGRSGRELVKATAISNDWPHTRVASFHVNGLEYLPMRTEECPLSTLERQWICGADGDNVGLNRGTVHLADPAMEPMRDQLERQGTLVRPGQSAMYRYRAFREGTYFSYSTGTTVGGEGDGGQIGMGLFGAVNVQPKGSKWYRSQVTHQDLLEVTRVSKSAPGRHPYRVIDYEKRYTAGRYQGTPVLAMLDGTDQDLVREITHSDLNAVVVLDGQVKDGYDTTSPTRKCRDYVQGNSCGKSYREFTVIMHDEVKAVQAFQELEDEGNPLHYVKDGMGINYGVGGMGAMVVARNRKVGPVKDCPECRAEEFFLSSWANGDPALILKWDKAGSQQPTGALYPDDPSNVHHSYLGDPVRFRNIHAGPKETHVFHLHAHQWVMDPSDPGSTYLDSQTISPGATFSYEVEFGGSGNRNLSPGDSIFHCHLYPHFAQGMWELWRVHDAFEDGMPSLFNPKTHTRGRNYPDAEVAGGTENPAIVPLPGSALAPMPTEDFRGYPFYVAGEVGHRPPQPPYDMDKDGAQGYVDGGLPRHVLKNGLNATKPARTAQQLVNQDVVEEALLKGGLVARLNAAKVYKQNPNALLALAEQWESLGALQALNPKGEVSEKKAIQFHAGELTAPGFQKITAPKSPHADAGWEQEAKGYVTDWATPAGTSPSSLQAIFYVNGRGPEPGAPYADPCPKRVPQRTYKAGVIQTELTVNRHGWFDPQARILALEQDIQDIIDPNTRTHLPEPLFFRANSGDCITFKHSNFLPNAMGLDDFQIYTPTDTVGEHIHLVKFDVTSSDGSGNGWNYEDGTFSPEEVRERVIAHNRAQKTSGKPAKEFFAFKTHPLFKKECAGDALCLALKKKGTCPAWSTDRAEMERRMPKLVGANPVEEAQIQNKLEKLKKDLKEISENHPLCGAQRTVQRWYADPILDPKTGKDHTLRTVFTHDHFGPSTHQQHGLYAALVVEPANSVWLQLGENGENLKNRDDWHMQSKVIGGADFLRAPISHDPSTSHLSEAAQSKALRHPLVLREDGGPTSTRANIVAPKCIGETRSNPLDPKRKGDCAEARQTHDTKREFAIAFADFAVLYNTALEPINPEERDLSALRFGHRQVATNLPKPLAISSEDPGTQLINYRNEPLPLRITDRTGNSQLGGFDYRQTACAPGNLRCTGDMANVFSTVAHVARDRRLAITNYGAIVSPTTREILEHAQLESQLDEAVEQVETWRREFNCALYPKGQLPDARGKCRIRNQEPWRVMGDPATPILPVNEGDSVQIRLIQGAQEAQHVFTMNGVKWLREPGVKNSGYVNAQPLGISEHFEFDIKVMNVDASVTDYLYFGSSVDQLWDGMWGVMRASGKARGHTPEEVAWKKAVAPLPGMAASLLPDEGFKTKQVCAMVPAADRLKFDISVVRACQLVGGCDGATSIARKGIPYNERLGLDDPNAIVFVRNNKHPGAVEEPRSMSVPTRGSGDEGKSPDDLVLESLQREFKENSRRLEPLVLRAPAGSCMEVQVRNHLPQVLPDGPDLHQVSGHFSDNFMSMTLDGFNYNQFRMSSSVGLSAPLVAQYVRDADGSNVGRNGEGNNSLQGGLVPPCSHTPGQIDAQCKPRSVLWYAGDYRLEQKKGAGKEVGQQVAVPIEFGAIPLRSFGDVIKHPAHGAIGALVIGPKDSKICQSDDSREQLADRATDMSATICDAQGTRLYRDFVMVLQDSVDAKQAGWPIPNLKGAEEPDDYGLKAVNYRTEPIWGRRGGDPSIEFEERSELDHADVLSSKTDAADSLRCQAGVSPLASFAGTGKVPCDPETPVFVARAGSEVRVRVVHPGGHTRQQAFTLHGHHWNPFPWKPGVGHEADSAAMYPSSQAALTDSWTVQGSYNGVGPMMAANLLVKAGGQSALPMDYLFRSQASFVFDGGIWGLIRVLDQDSAK